MKIKKRRIGYWIGKKRPEMFGDNNPAKRLEVREKISKTMIAKGDKHPSKSLESREKNSKGRLGKKNPMYGRSVYDVWLEKHGKEYANKKQSELNKSRRIRRIKEKYGQIMPNYNKNACKLIDEYGKRHGCDFQHAENGGEKCIGGYWPDGVDEEKKVIIEIDEKHHFNFDGSYKKRDIEKQKYLESLGYKVIRIKLYK